MSNKCHTKSPPEVAAATDGTATDGTAMEGIDMEAMTRQILES